MPTVIDGSTGVTMPAGGVANTAGAAVGTTDTQTLTNKTLTSPTLTTPNINSAQFATVEGTAPIYPCRAWVNFNGTGTVVIRASGNVSSITDNGVGDYTVNFTNAMPDANYSAFGAATDTGNPITAINAVAILGTKTTSSIRAVFRTVSGAATYFDANTFDVAIFR